MPVEMLYVVKFVSKKTVLHSFNPSTAPYAFSTGDFVNPSGWGADNPNLPEGEQYKITAVEHQLSSPGNPEQLQHNVVISVEAIKRNTAAVA
jgi:hypothetical protein